MTIYEYPIALNPRRLWTRKLPTRSATTKRWLESAVAIEKSPLDFPAVEYARARLSTATEFVDPGVRHRMLTLLTQVSDVRTLYPSVATDGEGGLVALWQVGQSRLEIDIEPDGLFYVRERDGETIREWFEDAMPVASIAATLRKLTHDADRTNPAWRDALLK